MTSAIFNPIATVRYVSSERTELVRGADQDLKARLLPLIERQSIALDLSGVERIDAAGIATLILLYGKARQAGHRFTVANVPPRVRDILSLVGLDHILICDAAEAPENGRECERTAA